MKQVYYRLWFFDEKIDIDRQTLGLLDDLEKIARAQNEVGKVTLQDVSRARIEKDRLTTETANLEGSRNSLVAQLKGALGLTHDQRILRRRRSSRPRLAELSLSIVGIAPKDAPILPESAGLSAANVNPQSGR